jgi:hypothetical protein
MGPLKQLCFEALDGVEFEINSLGEVLPTICNLARFCSENLRFVDWLSRTHSSPAARIVVV